MASAGGMSGKQGTKFRSTGYMTFTGFRKWCGEYIRTKDAKMESVRKGGIDYTDFKKYTEKWHPPNSFRGIMPMVRMLRRLGCDVKISVRVRYPHITKGKSIYFD